MALKTDYKDDVLDTSKNTNRKYYLTNNADNTVSLTDVTSYIQEGDAFGSNDINTTNAKVNEIDESLNGFSFGVTADGKPGYKRGASTEIIPFKTTEVYYLGNGTSFDIKSKFPKEYSKLTVENFIVLADSGSASGSHSNVGYDSPAISSSCNGNFIIRKTYSNGILSASCSINCSANVVSGGPSVSSSGSNTIGVKAYLVLGDIETV